MAKAISLWPSPSSASSSRAPPWSSSRIGRPRSPRSTASWCSRTACWRLSGRATRWPRNCSRRAPSRQARGGIRQMDKRANPEELRAVAEADKARRPANPSVRGPIIVGLAIIVLFFGLLGTWAALSPLDGAIVSEGVVTVEGNRKTVDHLEGGIVKEIRVKDGDRGKGGDVLVVLDDKRPRAQ